MRIGLLLAAAAAMYGQGPSIRQETFQGRPAWVLSNGVMRVAILSGGGHIAEVRLTTGDARRDVNPMRVPHYATIDPQKFDPSRHGGLYGTDPHSRLSSGYMGHLLCLPYYGPVSSVEEAAAGLGNHGEAPVVEWKQKAMLQTAGAAVLDYEAELPLTRFRVRRRVTLTAGQRMITVEESVENLLPFDRPMQWMQHATFGPPFIAPGKSVLTVPVAVGIVQRQMPAEEKTGSYTPLRLDPKRQQQFFVMANPDYPVQIGYIFPGPDNPWLADWMENKRNAHKPWNSQVIARGIEFGNSPFAEGIQKAVERGVMEGVPAYQWIGASHTMTNRFNIFLDEPPAGKSIANATVNTQGLLQLTYR
jgi:hypothetical protein